jgi:hypothetical protein
MRAETKVLFPVSRPDLRQKFRSHRGGKPDDPQFAVKWNHQHTPQWFSGPLVFQQDPEGVGKLQKETAKNFC